MSVDAFISQLPKTARGALRRDAIEQKLGKLTERARQRWPKVSVPEDALVAHFGRLVADAPQPLAALEKLKLEDVYLALACARGDETAVAQLEALVQRPVRQAIAAQKFDPMMQDEVLQRLRARLFLAERGKPPRILGYQGHGPLTAWVCAAALRLAFDLKREHKPASDVDEAVVEHLADETDLELTVIKQKYRKEFRLAFQEAFRALEPQERNLLRFNFIDGLNIEQIGAMIGVHRSTVARRIAKVREELFEGTRRVLAERFKLTGSELNSLLVLVKSDFDVSLHEALAEPKSLRKR